jgi:uridine phosphorylase
MTVQPHLLIAPGDVSAKALVAGDPARIEHMARLLDNAREVARNRGYLVLRGRYEGKDVTLCAHGVGAPSATVAFIELWACGVQEIIRVGSCGAMQEGIKRGEIIIAQAAVRDEGTSTRYVHAAYPAVADLDLTLRLKAAATRQGTPYREGTVWTTDVFYAPDEAENLYWSARGILAVEMEVSALFTLARLRGLKAGAILVVDGNLMEQDQKLAAAIDETGSPAEHDAATRGGMERAIGTALEAI